MNTHSNYRINPLIQASSTDTLKECSYCLAYIGDSITGLAESDTHNHAYKGLRAITECIQLALEYEYYRLNEQYKPVQTQ